MPKILYTILFLTAFGFRSSGQVDSVAIQKFMTKHFPKEVKFINLVKQNKVDSCVHFFSTSLKNNMGIDSLKKEINKLNRYFTEFPNPKTNYNIGQPSGGVGAFGHNIQGIFELQSSYLFLNKDGDEIYSFTLYYTDFDDEGEIKYYESEEIQKTSQLSKPSKSEETSLIVTIWPYIIATLVLFFITIRIIKKRKNKETD